MKYFVVSDIHSDYTGLKNALKSAGFKKRNKDHTLIVCGDVFDRFSETVEVYNYIMSVPKKRRILIRGNHEDLYEELLKKYLPENYDYSNGTVSTFCQIAGYSPEVMTKEYWYKLKKENVYDCLCMQWREIVNTVKNHPITKWILGDEWKNYWELGRFIFVHSFIPVNTNLGPKYYTELFDWREKATKKDWFNSRWGCPFKQYKMGLFDTEEKNGKVLVCGHWVVTEFRQYLDCDFSENTDIYYSDHLIGLDGGCWSYPGTRSYYHPQNVLIIDDDKCYDQYGIELNAYKAQPFEIIDTVSAKEIEDEL